MSEWLANWLIGVTCAALLAVLARHMMPPGAVQQVGALVCALMLLWAMLRPLVWNEGDGRVEFSFDSGQTRTLTDTLRQNSARMLKPIIEQECAAYISDKAAEQGIACQVQVECVEGDAEVFLPHSVTVTGELTAAQRTVLTRLISSDMDVPAERQHYTGGE